MKSSFSNVLIIGAGLNGLSLACGLANSGFSVRVLDLNLNLNLDLDKSSRISNLRVSALTSESLEFLKKLGLEREIDQEFKNFKFKSMEVWESGNNKKLYLELGNAIIIQNNFLQKLLFDKAQSLGVSFALEAPRNIERTSAHIYIHTDQKNTWQADLLIGADGANSFVREFSGIKTKFKNYDQQALVCVIQTEKPHDQTAYQIFLPEGPLAFLPLENSHQCSIVWSCSPQQGQGFLEKNKENFEQELAKIFEHRLGSLKLISERLCFTLKHHHAEKYMADKTVLIGDAAHVIHPLAGLGLNLGFRDSEVLIKFLNLAKSQNRPLGSWHVLSKYERERRPHNAMISMGMTGINSLFKAKFPGVKILRSKGLEFVEKSKWWKRFFLEKP